jgi:hypothetical protein
MRQEIALKILPGIMLRHNEKYYNDHDAIVEAFRLADLFLCLKDAKISPYGESGNTARIYVTKKEDGLWINFETHEKEHAMMHCAGILGSCGPIVRKNILKTLEQMEMQNLK